VAGSRKQALVERVGQEVRQVGAQSALVSDAVASRFGLHPTDLECLDVIFLRGQATAGELAQATGLTSGAATALIDRLERAGYVERTSDPADGRRVMVRARTKAIAPIAAVYAPMQKRMFELWSSYGERELEVIADFLSRSRALSVGWVSELKRGAAKVSRRPPGSRRRARG
jgi:DNA-binding MarR family transcriptional regulator